MKSTLAAARSGCQPWVRLACAALACMAASCGSATREAGQTLRAFYTAVQEQDADALFCMLAGTADAEELGATSEERRAGFEGWAAERFAAYERGRDEGWVDLDEQGLVLVKLFALGRGTFASYGPSQRPSPGVLVIESRIRFGYAHIDLSPFSPGTTLYFCGGPVGRIHALRVPESSREVTVELLDGVTVEWTLVRSAPAGSCPGGWSVVSAVPLEGTEELREITWVF